MDRERDGLDALYAVADQFTALDTACFYEHPACDWYYGPHALPPAFRARTLIAFVSFEWDGDGVCMEMAPAVALSTGTERVVFNVSFLGDLRQCFNIFNRPCCHTVREVVIHLTATTISDLFGQYFMASDFMPEGVEFDNDKYGDTFPPVDGLRVIKAVLENFSGYRNASYTVTGLDSFLGDHEVLILPTEDELRTAVQRFLLDDAEEE